MGKIGSGETGAPHDDDYQLSVPPEGFFTQLATRAMVTCGIGGQAEQW
jgi:hypothetical protein